MSARHDPLNAQAGRFDERLDQFLGQLFGEISKKIRRKVRTSVFHTDILYMPNPPFPPVAAARAIGKTTMP